MSLHHSVSLRGTFARVCLLLLLGLMVGCATGPAADRRDPLEPFNRGVWQVNDALDRAVVRPAATAYRDVLPSPVRTGITNFFHNLQDAWSVVNNTLQLKGEHAGNSFFRFGVNSVFGLGGVLDIASEMGIERHTEGFGDTLGYWGVGPGPYLVLPILGPSTVRDTAAMWVDSQGNLIDAVEHIPSRNSATFLKMVNQRAQLLQATAMLDQVALDPYTFTRDAFLQRRRNSVFDGNPPEFDEFTPETLDEPQK
ncbi:MAG: VacJ family lipoprotein [Rhodoferax sp.]|jgi:phospholipid-binding lipoprotein MlaA|uniref:MlaA family lipoprotein n=1 Tax=Rhodoferax sp. TaxID=50421 RepID=UPI001B4499EF|nr:VacJ family lipoprotein [Rhodoferax sp.]MBP9148213.1 VacJ family lipoprotein [Rhodoferax sp.]MBP9734770.1 VacJ family lipoprotein [Rhodoferax sp.]